MARSRKIPTRRTVKREKLERRHLEKTKMYAHPKTLVLSRPGSNPGKMDWSKLSEPVKVGNPVCVHEKKLPKECHLAIVQTLECVMIKKGAEWYLIQEIVSRGRKRIQFTGRWNQEGILGEVKSFDRSRKSGIGLRLRLQYEGFKVHAFGVGDPENVQDLKEVLS